MTGPLTHQEKVLLSDIVSRRAPDQRETLGRALRGERLSIEEANLLRDAIGVELAETGVDADVGAVVERGRELDELIDRIASISQLHDT